MEAVWYDEHNLGWGALRQEIDRHLRLRQHFIAILSQAAVDSEWVNIEIDAALALHRRQSMQTIQFVTAARCEVSPTLERYKRIENAGGQPFPPEAAAMRAQRVITGLPMDPPSAPPPLPRETLPALSPAPAPANSAPAHHLTPMPLYTLGYRGYSIGGVECILPPVCPVPAGVFTMGSDKSREQQARDETPQYPVEVDGFAIGQHPVTVAEYARAAQAKAVREPPAFEFPFPGMQTDWAKQQTHPNHPVVCISWNDALAYTRWLARLTGQPWRLPSEAEWEKAVRGSDGRLYPWGDDFDRARCNTSEGGPGATTPVDSYPTGASPFHAQDMVGNVWECTSSLFQRIPTARTTGGES